MARKSQWAQFAENFESGYKMVSKVRQAYDTNQIMDDEKFLAEGGGGYNAETGAAYDGEDLEMQRYKALGDVATKYGDAAGGLSNRQALEGLRQSKRDNRIGEATEQNTIALKGLMVNQARANVASTQTNTAIADQELSDLRNSQEWRQYSQTEAYRADVAQSGYILQTADLKTQAGMEAYTTQIRNDYANQNTAKLEELKSLGFLNHAERFQNNEFETAEEAKDAYIQVVMQFDPFKAKELDSKYDAEEIGDIANMGAKYQAQINRMMQQSGGLKQFSNFIDKENGPDTGVVFTNGKEGVWSLTETDKDGAVINELFNVKSEAEARAAIQEISTYGNAAGYYEKVLSRKADKKNLELVEANIGRVNQVVSTAKIMEDLTKKQGELVVQQTAEIIAGLDLKRGLANNTKEKLMITETAEFLSKLLLMDVPDEERAAKVAAFVAELGANNDITVVPVAD